MTNQSKWLISAYAIFFCGGVLVPLDYKLTSAEHLEAARPFSTLSFSSSNTTSGAPSRKSNNFPKSTHARTVLVTEAPANADLAGALRWEDFRDVSRTTVFVRASAPTPPASSIPPARAAAPKAAC